MIFSVFSAANYFPKGDNACGAFSLSQSVHTFGGLTGINEAAIKIGKHILCQSAKSLAKKFTFRERLGTILHEDGKVHGKRSREITWRHFCAQDMEELADLDLDNPKDVKLLLLCLIHLALHVHTMVLNLIGTFCPEVKVIANYCSFNNTNGN